MTITELAIKRPTLVVVAFTVLGVLGVFGYMQLKYDLMPKMTAPVITITTIYPGGSPSEVETSITKFVEDVVTGLDKVNTVRSQSSESRSFVSIEFDQDADINIAMQDAQSKINTIVDRLPQSAKKPVLSKISFDEIPVLRMAVYGNMATKEFYQYVKDRVQPRISKVDGVGQVVLNGGEEREIKVNIDQQKLKSYGLSLFQVALAVKASNVDFPTGNVKDMKNQFIVRVAGKFSSVEEMKELVIARSKQGGEVKLRDVGEVIDGMVDVFNINRLNGITSIGILVQKTSDGNTVEVSQKVRKELKELEKENKNIELKFEISQDGSDFILASANAVKEDLGLAILLVAFVMFIFLHSFRNSFIVLVAIPSSLISTFFMMYIFNMSLNLMTLLGMSLVIGILVDDSIVVLENIYRHLKMGQNQKLAALNGRNEIGFAALSITFVDVVVFLPLALIVGMIGNFLREYALVVVFSTLMSLFVSFTITPMLASRFTKLEHSTKDTLMGRFSLWFENLFTRFTRLYKTVLEWSLHHGVWIVIVSFALFIMSLFLPMMGFIGNEFIPVVDRGEMIVTIELTPGASIEETNQIVSKIERVLSKMPEVERVLSNVGQSSEGFIGVYSNNAAELDVTFVGKNQRKKSTDELGQELKTRIFEIPGVKARVAALSLMGTSNNSPIQMRVSGTDIDSIHKAARMVFDIVKSVKGTTDVRLSSEEGKPELKIEIDRKKMSSLGLTINDIGSNLRIALTGDDDSKFRDGINEYSIRIMLDQFDRANPEQVGGFTFINNKGQSVELKQFASIYQAVGPTKLERENRIPTINIKSEVFNRTSGEIQKDIIKIMNATVLPNGVTYDFAGQLKYMADSFKSLFYALFAGILFVFLIMVALYDSYLYPFVVLFSIPVAIVGALFGLALTMKSISIYSMLGIIMLIGLVAKNAILIVDRTNQMKLEGMTTYEALVEAAQTRLRPILMTTFSMIMGMMPIALSKSAGSEAKSGLAVVLIGGLFTSMMLTLVLVPVVYQSFDKMKAFFHRRKKVEALEVQ